MHDTDVNLQIAKYFIDPRDLRSASYMKPNTNYKNIFHSDEDIYIKVGGKLYKRSGDKLELYRYRGGQHFIEANKIEIEDDND